MLKSIRSLAIVLSLSATALAVNIDTVFVGNPGNAGELSGESTSGYGPDRVTGGVDHLYHIGEFEVTAGQYTDFLNAVATSDTYGLYNPLMFNAPAAPMIEQTGSDGSYSYSVAEDWADRPVNFVSWGDAARFCNWLENGQPSGLQDLTTTEDGSYFLDGATDSNSLLAVTRKAGATWVIPSEDEWYKAAYHKNDGATANYFDYPTGSDTLPSNLLNLGGNNATFYDAGYTIGGPYWRTEVGAHANSPSPYGTYDQGGNVWEWNEAVIDCTRGVRGGAAGSDAINLDAGARGGIDPVYEDHDVGFRVVKVPEPVTSALFLFGGLTLVTGRRREPRR